ncbi:exonuclease SbcCD subunit D [Aerococcus loyolae]|uniref:Nuclease SbcCD subunit D n=1 Tax=Aerococcus urinae TaxID=1376 RepID=A0A2I1L652_9LACT|nr:MULTISPECIES: exonuclease SbcCD subunit D [Aerococcus]MCY3067753.1 exonuclease SbcCD subunit D [Aerococcus mictus]MCY3080347.1 exonuclease SbcCD subunit D [Aerococcus mictus]MDK6728020.1 exonuclease SbcCD subunit D [Aerococcus urinae]MDK7909374.1 exonuclease SbcCD subunit D [Aerococcus urinae]MDK8609675.1 exonuclease SbcCD subunit D [Aerococcus urinae]
MKFIHTSDWHIGKIVNDRSMLADQEVVLHQLIDDFKAIGPDLVIIAGDFYDRSLPSRDSVRLANDLIDRMMLELDCPVAIIAGNHDAGERIAYGARAYEQQNVHLAGLPQKVPQSLDLPGARVYLLPYADYQVIRELYQDPTIDSLEKAAAKQVQAITSQESFDPERLNLIVYHGYVTASSLEEAGADLEESESERPLSIGTTEYVPSRVFQDFDYLALGHLHGAQRVKGENVRYSGSPLKYSKSEAHHHKQYLEVDLTKERIQVTKHMIQPLHDVRVITTSFDQALAGESEDYIYFELTDQTPVHDGMNRLRENYPNIMNLEYLNIGQVSAQLQGKMTKEKLSRQVANPIELFSTFYQDMLGQSLTKGQSQAVETAWLEAQKESETD